MTQQLVDFIGLFSGVCSIVALLLYFISIPKQRRSIYLLITSILIGLPLILFVFENSILYFSVAICAYTSSIIWFSYLFGKVNSESRHVPLDLIYATNERSIGQKWILEKVINEKEGTINIDCFGVKLDALYKVIKGATFKSKIPYDRKVSMRVLLLEPDSFGVNSRALLENNKRVKNDVELMNGVYFDLVKEYKRHQNHILEVKTFEFTPGFYILRVNNSILVGTYLAESGYENLCMHFERRDGKTFNQYERFFERVWSTYSKHLSSTNK